MAEHQEPQQNQFATGGPLLPGSPSPIPVDHGSTYAVPASVARAHGRSFLERLNAGEPIPPRGAPKTPEYGATVRAACDELAAMLIRSFEDVLADPDYGDASGHLGGNGLSALAEVAIDTVYEYLRGTTETMMARGRTIEISNRDEAR